MLPVSPDRVSIGLLVAEAVGVVAHTILPIGRWRISKPKSVAPCQVSCTDVATTAPVLRLYGMVQDVVKNDEVE